jgi:hypothetical protein
MLNRTRISSAVWITAGPQYQVSVPANACRGRDPEGVNEGTLMQSSRTALQPL